MEMKTIDKYIYFIASFASLFFASCSKDFLDIKPAGKVNENSFFTDTTNIDLMVSGVYNAFELKSGMDLYDGYRMWFGSISSDEAECGGDKPTAWGEGYSYDDHSFTADASFINGVYGAFFDGVTRASEVIEKLPEAKKIDGISNNTLKKINIRLGETYFLRAAYNFALTRVFGGVPVVDHILLPSEYKTMPRGTIKDVYNQMEKDLKMAIQYLPLESQISAREKGRISKGAAQGLLAKMYVYESSYFTYYGTNDIRMGAVQDRWKEAFDLCQEIINSKEYVLLGSIDDPKRLTYSTFWTNDLPGTNGFRFLFSIEGNNNRESMFAIQHLFNTGYSSAGVGSSTNTYIGARALYYKVNGQNVSSGEGGHNWGFWVPTHKLDNLYDPLDIRRKVTIGRGPDSISGYPGDSVYGVVNKVKGWYTIVPTAYPATGLETFKYEIGPFLSMVRSANDWQGNSQNMYYLRYADVILLAAEAAMMLNDQANAFNYFNMIRERARSCGDGIHPADLTGNVTKQEIMDEREREFAIEGERFFDLVRWKEAYNVINGSRMEWWDFNGYNTNYNSLLYVEPRDDFFPLPSLEVSKNSNLKQYEGW
jgi:starch-binding outer membrane protein, SusD/RagB family